MGELLKCFAYGLCLPFAPFFVIADIRERRKYEALKAAERQKRVDEANGL